MPNTVDPWALVSDFMKAANARAGVRHIPAEALGDLHRAALIVMVALAIPVAEPPEE